MMLPRGGVVGVLLAVLCASLIIAPAPSMAQVPQIGLTGTAPSDATIFTLKWTTDLPNNIIYFEMTGASVGWVSLSFSNTGSGHAQADSCTAWLLPGQATGVIYDGYSDGFSQPVIQATNNCKLISITEAGGSTTVQFSRTISSPGDQLLTIPDGPISISGAIADADGNGQAFPNKHSKYQLLNVNFITGGASAAPIIITPDIGVTGSVTALLLLYAAIKFARNVLKDFQSQRVMALLPNGRNLGGGGGGGGGRMQRLTRSMSRMMGFGGNNNAPGFGPPSGSPVRGVGPGNYGFGAPQNRAPSFKNTGRYRRRETNNVSRFGSNALPTNAGLPSMVLTTRGGGGGSVRPSASARLARTGGGDGGDMRVIANPRFSVGIHQRRNTRNNNNNNNNGGATNTIPSHLSRQGGTSPSGRAVQTKLKPKKLTGSATNSLRSFLRTRVGSAQVAMSDVLVAVLFLVINAGWMFYYVGDSAAPLNTTAAGLGYLCSPSMVFVALPATRNSLLTLMLQIPFEAGIMFHRWLGVFLFWIATGHMGLYFYQWAGDGTLLTNLMVEKYRNGYISWLFLALLNAASTGPVRRLFYNTFKWLHFSFFGFYIFAVIHSPTIFNYAIAATVVYGVDRLIRLYFQTKVLTAYEVRALAGDVIRVRFAKHRGIKYEAGQYVFLKIPVVSQLEWHPYTLSSGPHEPFAEVHIKSLGDHTGKLLRLITRGGSVPTVRVDGPYGHLSLKYERYENIILIGGGVGVTPMVSILKDIYQINMSDAAKKQFPRSPHNKRVVLCWTVPSEDEWRWFSSIINEALELSNANGSTFPALSIFAHVTKAGTARPMSTMHTETERFLLRAGRPDLRAVFDLMTNDCEAATGRRAHRVAVYACGPGKMVNDAWDLSKQRTKGSVRFDFHHEVFDF